MFVVINLHGVFVRIHGPNSAYISVDLYSYASSPTCVPVACGRFARIAVHAEGSSAKSGPGRNCFDKNGENDRADSGFTYNILHANHASRVIFHASLTQAFFFCIVFRLNLRRLLEITWVGCDLYRAHITAACDNLSYTGGSFL